MLDVTQMTPKQMESLANAAEEQLARVSLLDYCQRMSPGFESPPHIRLIIEHLEALERGDIHKLMICMPPRHGKTFLTRLFCSWYFGRNPRAHQILASYGIELPTLASREIRAHLRDEKYPFDVRVAKDSASVERLHTDAGGVLIAAGVGGAITGFGFDLGVVDDPTKDAQAAASVATMESTWSWYNQTYSTRRMSGGKELIIGTIWSARDLISRIMDSELTDQWTILRLPAFAEENDPLCREVGAALWPAKYDENFLNEQRTKLGTKAFSALYQNLPLGGDGGRFKLEWFGSYTAAPDDLGRAIFVDSSAGKNAKSDYTVILTAGLDAAGKIYILDVVRQRVQFHELQTLSQDVIMKNRGVPFWVEDANSGTQLIQSLRAWGIPARALKPVGNKEYRFDSIVPYVERGQVLLPERAPWLNAFLREVLADSPVHDDQLDCLSYAVSIMTRYVREQQGAATMRGPFWPS